MKATVFIFVALFFSATTLQAEEIIISRDQMKSLGIFTAHLPSKMSGELAAMPAQVVIPSNQQFTVSTPLPAMIEQTLVGVGDSVKKGQVLAILQSPALAEAQRALLHATTQAQLAQENFNRDEQLWKDGIIAESRYRTSKSQQHEAAVNLAESKQILKLAGLSDSAISKLQGSGNLNSTLSITSPMSGVILEKTASTGQRLDAATPLFKVAELKQLGLEIQAPLESTHDLKIGATVTVPSLNAKGKLTAIGRSLSGSNQTILLRALVTEGAENLRPGQYVEANIATHSTAQVQWTIPNSALARVGNRTVIFTVSAKGFTVEPVQILHEGADNSVITGKLKGSELIAVKGVSSLKANLMGIGGGQ